MDHRHITYSPGDYLFNLAAKVVVYVTDPAKPALDPELRSRSHVLAGFHDAVLARASSAYQKDWVQPVLEEMHRLPALQEPLAYLVDYVPSKWLLEQEVANLCAARKIHRRPFPQWPPDAGDGKPFSRCDPTTWQAPDTVHQWASEAGLNGLCLSGGGIRSATFNLGILQGLAAQRKLGQFDYLSSVSGGGYIHGWLAGWLRRESGRKQQTQDREAAAREALSQVQEEMSPIPAAASDSSGSAHRFAPPEIQWLRRFSNYLTPEKGLLTLDTWTAVAIWLRNTFLNQLVLIAALLCLLLLPWWMATMWHAGTDICPPPKAGSAPTPTHYTLAISGALDQLGQDGAPPSASAPVLAPSSAPAPPKPAARSADHAATLGSQSTFSLTMTNATHGAEELSSDKFKVDYCLVLSQEAGNHLIKQQDCLPEVPSEVGPALTRAGAGKPHPPSGPDNRHDLTLIFERISFSAFVLGAFSLGLLLWQEFGFTRRQDEEERQLDAEGQVVHDCQRPYIYRPHCRRDFGESGRTFAIVAALLCPSIPFCYALCCPGPGRREVIYAAIGLFSLALAVVVGGNAFCSPGKPRTLSHWLRKLSWKQLPAAALASLLGTAVFVLVAALIRTATVEHWGAHLMKCSVPAVELALGVPLLATLPFLTVSLVIGLAGHSFADWMRELLGRILAITFLASLGWLAFFSIALLSPGLFLDATMHGTTLKFSSIAAWIATTIASVISGKSPSTSGSASPSKGAASLLSTETLATVGPYVYILGLLVVLSSAVQLWVDVDNAPTRALIAIAVCAAITLVFGWRLDATAFSLFPFYRNRLTRCYLGASNRSREPNPLTGFDDHDTRGLQLRCLTAAQGYPGPFPIFNATLNLTTGTELAYQERKGASFFFTPLYSGYAVSWTEAKQGTQFNGFVPTETYGAPDGGLNIASAIAISGAAVSPNWGYHTKPATAFLLTMFNARLGCWLPNTRKQETTGRCDTKTKPGALNPPDGRVLLHELIGSTDDSRDFIYLTDGGHFDNMGLYELVRRRCYDIVICDAEEDEEYKFDGIGSTIRKCRIDFGVEIDLDLSKLRKVAATGFSSAHVVTGKIRYPEAKAGTTGSITYIKASLVTYKAAKGSNAAPSDLPDVPADVQSYYLQHGHFPHDSTLQQWFTESQFESYRRLGQSVAESVDLVGKGHPVRPRQGLYRVRWP
jgi:hypothetical protein